MTVTVELSSLDVVDLRHEITFTTAYLADLAEPETDEHRENRERLIRRLALMHRLLGLQH